MQTTPLDEFTMVERMPTDRIPHNHYMPDAKDEKIRKTTTTLDR